MFSRATRTILAKPEGVEVKARRIDFSFDAKVPRYWFENDAFQTHFLNALSLTFPEGERMFMDAVRAVRERVQNPATRADITGFLGQEALHSRAHEALNAYFDSLGYPMAELERYVRDDIAEHRPNHTKSSLLAMTCALEHITAIMGNQLLSHPELQEKMHESIRPLWLWHALEETEHKAVAFDAYQELYGHYRQRVLWLLIGTVGLITTATLLQAQLLKKDGLADKPGVWLKGLWKLWGPRGWLLQLFPEWLAYLRPDFHPWQQDNSALIAKYRAEFEQQVEQKPPAPQTHSAASDQLAGSATGKRASKKSAQPRM